jgi:ArsR family transcriptional regulator
MESVTGMAESSGIDTGAAGRPEAAAPPASEALDRRYQALSDPKRRRILDLLGAGERCVCELAEELEVSQSLLSFHLKTLKEADLVADRRDGRWVHYRTRPAALAELEAHLAELAPAEEAGTDAAGKAGPRC